MTAADPIVQAGAAAWERLKSRERKSFDDWIAVARAISIGRVEALKAAETNRPLGRKYNLAMRRWLRKNGLADIVPQERYKLLLILENLTAIEAWSAKLSLELRRRLNHPGAIWSRWRQASATRPGSNNRHHVDSALAEASYV
jgi:hypothetical protein